MQTGSVWGFLPWYRFKQTMSFSGSGLFYDIFAVLALIFSKIVNIYQVYTWLFWYLHNSNTIGSNVVRLNLLFFSKSTCIFIFKIFLRHVHRVYVFLILLLAYFCKNDTFIFAICFPTMFIFSLCQPETMFLKRIPFEKMSSWNRKFLKRIRSEKISSWNRKFLKRIQPI